MAGKNEPKACFSGRYQTYLQLNQGFILVRPQLLFLPFRVVDDNPEVHHRLEHINDRAFRQAGRLRNQSG